MRTGYAGLLAFILTGVQAVAAAPVEYQALAEPAIVYDAGSREAHPLHILLRGTPVEVIVSNDRWVKVRDASGSLGWVERRQLGKRDAVIVTAVSLEGRERPQDDAPVVFSAPHDALLPLAAPPAAGWVRLRNHAGKLGYARVRDIWGL